MLTVNNNTYEENADYLLYHTYFFYYINVIRYVGGATENVMTRETTRWTTQTYIM